MEELKESINDQIAYFEQTSDDKEAIDKIKEIKEVLNETSANRDIDENINHLKNLNEGLSRFQIFKQSLQRDLNVDPGRLLGLTDGIFGMVMTLLIFGMVIPDMQFINSGDFINFMFSLSHSFGMTIVSFILLGSFWIYHHEFFKIENMDIPFLWLNMFYLAGVSFIPFTTSVLGGYSNFLLSEILFGVNVFLVVLMFLFIYSYAYKRDFLESKPSDLQTAYIFHTFFIILMFTAAVAILTFFVSSYCIYLYLLIPVISTLRDIHFRMIQ